MTRYRLTVADSAADLARRVAEQVASCIDLALAQRDRAQIALSGGQTPRDAYVHLGAEHLPWDRVDVLLGDERWVAADDPSSNALMIRETLIAQGPGSQARFHPVPTDRASPQQSADAYEVQLRALCAGDPPCFDLMLLGLGDDGHTASLFPGTSATEGGGSMGDCGRRQGVAADHPHGTGAFGITAGGVSGQRGGQA